MSAICGIVRFDGKPVDSIELETMVESSPYRGPDDVGYHVHGNAGFAHLAFHVTPESVHEKQPLISNDGRLVLVADVRLDNRAELYGKLNLGHDLNTPVTDPELILFAYRKWGKSCVKQLLGDFVFSIWDTRAKTLFLARDALGAYSVTYHQAGSCFTFASETTAILDLPFVKPVINEDRVLRAIEFLPRSHEATFFESIFYLPPAHCMEVSSNNHKLWRYWDIDPDFHTSYKTDDEYAEHLLELIDKATACRMRCIGPVGISLSGGNDSTLVAASAARQLAGANLNQSRLMSFSYVFNELKECDERKYIEPVVEQYGLDAHYIQGDGLWTFRNFNTHPIPKDQLWTNCFVNLPLSVAQSAQNAGCRVLLNGQVGDALFGGSSLAVADMLSHGEITALLAYLKRHSQAINWRTDVFLRGFGPLAPNWLRRLYLRSRNMKPGTFIGGLSPNKRLTAQSITSDPTRFRHPPRLAPSVKKRYGATLNAAWSQGFAAARGSGYNRFGIEELSPLYDRRIVEFILSLPDEAVTRPGKPRNLQKSAMKHVLPDVVCNRTRKTTFDKLLETGLVKEKDTVVKALAENSLIVQEGWVNKAWLESQITLGDNLQGAGYPLTHCLHLELWLRAIKQQTQNGQRWSDSRPPSI